MIVCASSTSGIAGEVLDDRVVARGPGGSPGCRTPSPGSRAPPGRRSGANERITPRSVQPVEPRLHRAAGDAEPRGRPRARRRCGSSASRRTMRASSSSRCGRACMDRVSSLDRHTEQQRAHRDQRVGVPVATTVRRMLGHDDDDGVPSRCRPPTVDLTQQEREADLDLEQLKQLVGLVEYDESQGLVPGHRLGRDRLRRRQRHPDRALLPVRLGHGAGRLLRPGDRQPRPQVVRAASPARSGSSSTARSTPTARCSTTTAGTATASSTSPSRCPTSTGASPRPARAGATVARRSPTTSPTSTARSGSPPSRRTARPGTRWSTASRYDGPYLPGYVAAQTTWYVKREGAPEAAVPGPRPRRRQRRARPDGRVGRASTTRSWAS